MAGGQQVRVIQDDQAWQRKAERLGMAGGGRSSGESRTPKQRRTLVRAGQGMASRQAKKCRLGRVRHDA
jgi:hypothetical protein